MIMSHEITYVDIIITLYNTLGSNITSIMKVTCGIPSLVKRTSALTSPNLSGTVKLQELTKRIIGHVIICTLYSESLSNLQPITIIQKHSGKVWQTPTLGSFILVAIVSYVHGGASSARASTPTMVFSNIKTCGL